LTDLFNLTKKTFLRVENQLSPTCTLLANALEFSGNFLHTKTIDGDRADSKILPLYLDLFKRNQVKPH